MFVINSGYIYFSHYCDDDRARVSTGIKIPKGKKGIVREELKKSEQLQLGRIEDVVIKYIESNKRLQSPIYKAAMEAIVKKALGKQSGNKTGFIDVYRKMVEDMRSGALLQPRTKKRYSDSTATNYEGAIPYFENFSKTTGMLLLYGTRFIQSRSVSCGCTYLTVSTPSFVITRYISP